MIHFNFATRKSPTIFCRKATHWTFGIRRIAWKFPCCLLLILPSLAEQMWTLHTIDASSKGADGVRLLDVNGDGLQDIATGWEEGGVVRAYLHPGHAAVKQEAPWPAVTVGSVKSAEDAVFVDLDADGAVDVVSSCEGGVKSMFVHWAPKTNYLEAGDWKTEAITCTEKKQAWMYAMPLQIDGKHGVDLLTGSKGKDAAVGWLQAPENSRRMADWRWHRLTDAGWIMSLLLRDMNADGRMDVLVSDRKGPARGIYWLENPGPEAARSGVTWTRHNLGGADREIMFIDTGDLDRDGREDIIGAAKGRDLLWLQNNGNGFVPHEIPMPEGVGSGKSAAIVDVDGDGQNDVVFSCEHAVGELSGVRWLSWTDSPRTGKWTRHEIGGPVGVKYDRVVLTDVDGDEDPDVLCCEERDQLGVFWYENPGAGNRKK